MKMPLLRTERKKILRGNIYLFKVNNTNTRIFLKICSKLLTRDWRQWRLSIVFTVNYEHISYLFSDSYCWLSACIWLLFPWQRTYIRHSIYVLHVRFSIEIISGSMGWILWTSNCAFKKYFQDISHCASWNDTRPQSEHKGSNIKLGSSSTLTEPLDATLILNVNTLICLGLYMKTWLSAQLKTCPQAFQKHVQSQQKN